MKYFRKFGRRRMFRKRGIRRARPVRKVSKSVRRYVKNAIHRQIENKMIVQYGTNNNISSVTGASTPASLSLIPTINQGNTENTRVGNCVKIVSGIVKGRVNILPYSATNNSLSTPVLITMKVLRNLQIAGVQATTNYDWTTLLRQGATTTGFTASPLDHLLPINEEAWRLIYQKEFKIGAASATSGGQVGTGGYYDNSPMSVPFYFNWGKYCKKLLKFPDSSNSCTNANLLLIFQSYYADGSATAVIPAEWHYCNVTKYEDA